MEFNFNSYGNSKQFISYCEVDKCKTVIKLKKCLAEIKEIAREYIGDCSFSWQCEECCFGCWANEVIQKIKEVENEQK